MNCGKIKDLLSAYIDDRLKPSERKQVERHLTSCPDCAQELALLRRTVELTAALPQLELPGGFHESLRARLAVAQAEQAVHHAAEISTASAPASGGRGIVIKLAQAMRRPSPWRTALATAAALMLTFGVVKTALPSWDGNVFNLPRFTQYRLSTGGLRGEGGADVGPTSAPPGQPDTSKAPGGLATDSGQTPYIGSDRAAGGVGTTTDSGIAATITMALTDGSMIIRSATLNVEVKDFATTERQVVPIVDAAGGYIEGSSVNLDGKVRSGWYRVRVPQAKFNEVVAKFEELGKPVSREMGTEDVSGTVIDLEARITNLRRQELRLGELLSQAKTLDEILRVENELNRVRYQIEAAAGQLKWYQGRVAMSSIYLYMSEPGAPGTPPVPGADLWNRLWQAFVATWKGIGRFLEGLVVFVASVTPVAVVLVGMWWGYGRYRRNRDSSRRI